MTIIQKADHYGKKGEIEFTLKRELKDVELAEINALQINLGENSAVEVYSIEEREGDVVPDASPGRMWHFIDTSGDIAPFIKAWLNALE